MKLRLSVLFLVAVAACSDPGKIQPTFYEEENPATLAEWRQMVVRDGNLTLASRATPYDLNTPLFTDYAHKLRTVWVPEGSSAAYRENDVMDFPVGTVITKTFYYEVSDGGAQGYVLKTDQQEGLPSSTLSLDGKRLIETRLLVHRESGWAALPYVWNEAQTNATLMRAGDIQQLTLVNKDGEENSFPYIVPDANQCAGCHATNNTTREIQPIGPKPRHLNRNFVYSDGTRSQLDHWQEAGLLTGAPAAADAPKNAVWTDETASLEARARAYLDANCSHCHSKVGPADTSGLHLEPSDPIGPNYGLCKPPIAAGTGTGGRRFGIVPGAPDKSIFTYRIESDNPAEMMPELGRSLVHEEGAALIRDWIAQLDGACG